MGQAPDASAAECDAGRALRLLREVDAILGEAAELRAALYAVARRAHDLLDVACAVALCPDDGEPTLVTACAGGRGEAGLERLLRREPRVAEAAVAWLSEECAGGQPCLRLGRDRLHAAAAEADRLAVLDAVGASAALLAPVVARGQVIGLLALLAERPERFDGDAAGLAVLLAARIAAAADRARLEAEAREARHAAEVSTRALEAARAIHRAVGDAIPFGTWAADAGGGLTFMSESLLRLAGRSLDEVEGQRWLELVAAPERERARSEWRACVAAGAVWDRELPVVGADGAVRHVLSRAVPVRDLEARVLCWAGINLDVTGLKTLEHERAAALEREHRARAEAELGQRRLEFLSDASAELAASLEYEATLERVVEIALPFLADWCALALLSDNGSTVVQLLTSSALTSRDPLGSVLQGPFFDGLLALEELRRAARGELVTAEGLPSGLALDSPDAREALAQSARLYAPLTARGRTLGVLLLVHRGFAYGPADVALAELLGRRAALAVDSAQLYRDAQEATRLRDEFLSVASHELRTPISGLQLITQSCLRAARAGSLEQSQLEPRLARAERQVDRLNRLVTSLLDVTRIRSGHMELDRREVDLAGLLRELIERYGEEFARAGCELLVLAEGPVVGHWDRLRLDQVVTNLLTNALKYGAGQPVEIALEATPELARLTVRDHGIGIALEDQARIFERFERAAGTGFAGLGLGLWIARAIAQAHGGSIKLVSRPGEGAAFTLELPRGGGEARAGTG